MPVISPNHIKKVLVGQLKLLAFAKVADINLETVH